MNIRTTVAATALVLMGATFTPNQAQAYDPCQRAQAEYQAAYADFVQKSQRCMNNNGGTCNAAAHPGVAAAYYRWIAARDNMYRQCR